VIDDRVAQARKLIEDEFSFTQRMQRVADIYDSLWARK
jgi:hypothetical protein